jgi:hypothetical protein
MAIDYAKKHGYDLFVDYEQSNNRGLMWHKFEMVQTVINASTHDWVWWMDFDTLITNTDIKLESIIEEALAGVTKPELVDWIFTADWYGYLPRKFHPVTGKLFSPVNPDAIVTVPMEENITNAVKTASNLTQALSSLALPLAQQNTSMQ